ncbi:MAG: hypothetical protein ABII90_06675 [Bacteroidota bacterium]
MAGRRTSRLPALTLQKPFFSTSVKLSTSGCLQMMCCVEGLPL